MSRDPAMVLPCLLNEAVSVSSAADTSAHSCFLDGGTLHPSVNMTMNFAATAPISLGSVSDTPDPERFMFIWGANDFGQCVTSGSPKAPTDTVPAPKLVQCRRPMKSLAAGWCHTLMVDNTGGLWGGGANHQKCLCEDHTSQELSHLLCSLLYCVPSGCARISCVCCVFPCNLVHPVFVRWPVCCEFLLSCLCMLFLPNVLVI